MQLNCVCTTAHHVGAICSNGICEELPFCHLACLTCYKRTETETTCAAAAQCLVQVLKVAFFQKIGQHEGRLTISVCKLCLSWFPPNCHRSQRNHKTVGMTTVPVMTLLLCSVVLSSVCWSNEFNPEPSIILVQKTVLFPWRQFIEYLMALFFNQEAAAQLE